MTESTVMTPNSIAVPGSNILLFGPPGSGKTHSLRTLVDAGLEVFILFTEPGMEVLSDTDPDQVHWNYTPPAIPKFTTILDNFQKINKFSNEALQQLTNLNAKDYGQAMDLLQQCMNFKDVRTGKEFGDVTEWGTDRVFVVDSLTGLNIMLLDLCVGAKPLKTLPDWGKAMDQEERLLNMWTLGTTCHFVLTAHVDRQVDEVMGGLKLLPAALGKKIGPSMGRFFSDVVMTERQNDKWVWNTALSNADTKARNLAWKDGLTPSFVPLINNWKSRQKQST